MSAPDPRYDVLFVERDALPLLPATNDPAATLRTQVPSPFTEPPGALHDQSCAVAVTVVSLLDEPVEGVGVYTPEGVLAAQPRVSVDTHELRPPWVAKQGGHTGYGWVDPAWSDGIVSVGSWVARDHNPPGSGFSVGKAALVLHLRCTGSNVDILIGGLAAPRFWPGVPLGGWNPYQIKLYEPGNLPTWPADSDYANFYNTYVVYQGTSDDTEGSSAAGTVSYLARSPQGRQDQLWHIMLMLGPRPIKALWNETPPPPDPAAIAARRAADVADAVNRLLVANIDRNPDEAAQRRIQDVTNDIPLDLLPDVLTEYQKRLDALADLKN